MSTDVMKHSDLISLMADSKVSILNLRYVPHWFWCFRLKITLKLRHSFLGLKKIGGKIYLSSDSMSSVICFAKNLSSSTSIACCSFKLKFVFWLDRSLTDYWGRRSVKFNFTMNRSEVMDLPSFKGFAGINNSLNITEVSDPLTCCQLRDGLPQNSDFGCDWRRSKFRLPKKDWFRVYSQALKRSFCSLKPLDDRPWLL